MFLKSPLSEQSELDNKMLAHFVLTIPRKVIKNCTGRDVRDNVDVTSPIDHPGIVDRISREPQGRHSQYNEEVLRFSIVLFVTPEEVRYFV